MSGTGTSVDLAAFRLLLRVYPRAFRRRYAGELEACFRLDLERPQHHGGLGAQRLWRRTLVDALRTAWELRRETRRERGPRAPVVALAEASRALTGLLRAPAWTATTVATLTLGVAATAAVLAVARGVLLHPLPYPESDRLVHIVERQRGREGDGSSWGGYEALRDSGAFEHVAIWRWGSRTLTGAGPATLEAAHQVSANLFATLGVEPILGRVFAPEETGAEPGPVVLLSYGLWSERFGADPAVLGRNVVLDDEPHTVIGVMPAGFDFPGGCRLWLPVPSVADPAGVHRWHRYRTIGRLAEGVDLEQAQRFTARVSQRLAAEHPETNADDYFEVRPLLDHIVGHVRPLLGLLLGAGLLLLLLAWVSTANLALVRGLRRERDLATRLALGASPGRLAALMIGEGVWLGLAAGLGAWLAARLAVAVLLEGWGELIPRTEGVAADGVVLGAAALLAVATGTCAALLPVLRVGRLGAATRGLRAGGHGRGMRLRQGLAVVQLALAIVLGSGALLLLRSVARLEAVETGVRSRDVANFALSLSAGRFATAVDVERFFERLLPELEELPGVERAAATLTLPVEAIGWRNYLTIRSRPLPEAELPLAAYVVVSPSYFESLGIPLLAGRGFEPGEGAPGRHVAVLSRSAAERHWPGRDSIGQRVLGSSSGESYTGLDEGVGGEWAEVIGVVGDVRQSLTDPPLDQVYVPIAQERVLGWSVVLRLAEHAPLSAAAIEERVHAVDPDVPVRQLEALEDRFARLTARPRLGGALISAFAAIALVVAVVGVYGVLLHSVAERRRELGVRAAIGASPGGLVWLVLREALGIAGVAALLGVAGSLAAGRLLESQLYGVAPGDPVSLGIVLGLLGLATLAASLRPARNAATLDPATVLREA